MAVGRTAVPNMQTFAGAPKQRLIEHLFGAINPSDRSDSLPVLLNLESLDTITRKIASAAKTAVEETWTNVVYLMFGFLEWFESDDSQQSHLAPLVIVVRS